MYTVSKQILRLFECYQLFGVSSVDEVVADSFNSWLRVRLVILKKI